jgi:hypothetical protein
MRNPLWNLVGKAQFTMQHMSYAENFCLYLAKDTEFRPMVASWKGWVTVIPETPPKNVQRIALTNNKNFKHEELVEYGMTGHKAHDGGSKKWVLAMLRKERAVVLNPNASTTDPASRMLAERYLKKLAEQAPRGKPLTDAELVAARTQGQIDDETRLIDARIAAVVANKVILQVTNDGFTRLPYDEWYHRTQW